MAERADLQHLLGEAIRRLPAHYREVVALRYAGDLPFAEVAETLGIPENTAASASTGPRRCCWRRLEESAVTPRRTRRSPGGPRAAPWAAPGGPGAAPGRPETAPGGRTCTFVSACWGAERREAEERCRTAAPPESGASG